MQVIQVGGHGHAIGVRPGTIRRYDRRALTARLGVCGLSAEVGAPGSISGTGFFGQSLAMRVCAFKSTEICAIANALAGDEKAHFQRLGGFGTHAHTGLLGIGELCG